MRIITKKPIEVFATKYPETRTALDSWLKIIKDNTFSNFSQLKKIFPSADKIEKCTVFNIGGNKVRLIAAIHYNRNIIYIREVLTHADYDTEKWQGKCVNQ
jgi:mRNA interferase HigB